MAANCYATAALPEPVRLLGLQLRPFSLGHYIKLKRFCCAFVDESTTDATIGDVLLGVLCCSMASDVDPSKDEFLLFADSKNFNKQVWKWCRKIRRDNIKEKAKLFASYIKRGSEMPLYWDGENDGAETGASWAHVVYECLVADLGYTPNEALNMPMSRALFDYFRHAERNGAVELMRPEDAEQINGS